MLNNSGGSSLLLLMVVVCSLMEVGRIAITFFSTRQITQNNLKDDSSDDVGTPGGSCADFFIIRIRENDACCGLAGVVVACCGEGSARLI